MAEERPMSPTLDTNVGEIVAGDIRAAEVFERYGIDFCCGGRRTLREACRERDVNPGDVLAEVAQACHRDAAAPAAAELDPDTLIAYITDHHHAYVRRMLPALAARTRKVASSHGLTHPELHEVAGLTQVISDEMFAHMDKEERILFPYISALWAAERRGVAVPAAPFGSVDNPIRVMEHEHEETGAALARIRALTHDYAVPAGACSTYLLCLRELEEFERDLHVHVHLENNVLFPRARAMTER
jgi:regulator of cell morphogenesis and NO signaling